MKPIEVKSEKVIHKPAWAVWQVIEPVAGLSKWLPLGERWELLSGQGAGRRQRMHAKWGNRPVEIDQDVIEYRPDEILRWRHVKELVNGKPAPAISTEVVVSVRLEAAGTGTRVILLSQNTPGNLLKALLITLVAKPRIRRAFDQALENVARLTA
jgi:uncharacterized membrane protein